MQFTLNAEYATEHGLTAREQDVLLLLARGLSAKEVALELGVEPVTVRSHIAKLSTRLEATNRASLVLTAVE